MQKKRELISAMLDHGLIQIGVNTQIEGVELPRHLLEEDQVLLNLSHRFPGSLELFDAAIHAELTFDGPRFLCIIPWEAIELVRHQERTVVFPPMSGDMRGTSATFCVLDELMPSGLLRTLSPLLRTFSPEDVLISPHQTLKKEPQLQVISGGGQRTPPRNPPLRLIK